MNRRQVLSLGARGALALGAAKTLHNTVLGYGHFGLGENITTQDLESMLESGLWLPPVFSEELNGTPVRKRGESVEYRAPSGWTEATAVDAPETISRLDSAITAVQNGDISWEFHQYDDFFDAVFDGKTLPVLVELLRRPNFRTADPDLVAAFTGTNPTDSQSLLMGLRVGFRSHTNYDIPRYLAGSVDDNLLPFDAGLRDPFRPTARLQTLLEADDSVGLFCGEYSRLAIAAIHSITAQTQSPPLLGMYVRNRHHKHVYIGVASAIWRDSQLTLPVTFLDYSDATLFDDLSLTKVLGEGFNAYDTNHRVDEIVW